MASIRAMTWNLWGLNEEHLHVRTRAVAAEVASVAPDLAFLQEIVPASERALHHEFARVGYSLVVPPLERRFPYYVGVAVRDASADIVGACTDDFPGTRMKRHVLSVRCVFRTSGLHVDAMTAHFESEGNTRERQAQALRTVELMTRSTSHLAIFGGDTNLRENETPIHAGLAGSGALPPGLIDAWEDTGSCEDTRHTKNIMTDVHPVAAATCGGEVQGGAFDSPSSPAAEGAAKRSPVHPATPSASAPEPYCRYDRIWFCAGSRLGLGAGVDAEARRPPPIDATPGQALQQRPMHLAAAFSGVQSAGRAAVVASVDVSPSALVGIVAESPIVAPRRRSAQDAAAAAASGGPLQPLPPQGVAGGGFFSPPPNVTARRLQLCPSSVKKPHLMFQPLLSPPLPARASQSAQPEDDPVGNGTAEPLSEEAGRVERWFDEDEGDEEGGARLLVCASARGLGSPAMSSSRRVALRSRAHTAPAGQIEHMLLTTDPMASAGALPTAFSLGAAVASTEAPAFFSAPHRVARPVGQPDVPATTTGHAAAAPAALLLRHMPPLPEEEAAAAEALVAGAVAATAHRALLHHVGGDASRSASELTRSTSTPGALGGGADASMPGSSQPLSQAAAAAPPPQQQALPAPASFAAAASLAFNRANKAGPLQAAQGARASSKRGDRPPSSSSSSLHAPVAATPVRATSAMSQTYGGRDASSSSSSAAAAGDGSGAPGCFVVRPGQTAAPAAAEQPRRRWRARRLWLVGTQLIDATVGGSSSSSGSCGGAPLPAACFSSDHRGVCAEIVLEPEEEGGDGDDDMGAAAAAAAFVRCTPTRA